MAIGRSEDRDTPGNPVMLRHRDYVRDPIRVTHLGQRSIRPYTQAGHMTATTRPVAAAQNPCGAGAVHTWIPGSPLRDAPERHVSVQSSLRERGLPSAQIEGVLFQ